MDGYGSAAVGKRVRAYRRAAGLTAEQLAEKIGGLTGNAIAKLENGHRKDVSTELLVQLAWALQVPPLVLLLPVDNPQAVLDVPGAQNTVDGLAYWIQGLPITGVSVSGATEMGNAVLAEFQRMATASVGFLGGMTQLVAGQGGGLPPGVEELVRDYAASRAQSRAESLRSLESLRRRLGLDDG